MIYDKNSSCSAYPSRFVLGVIERKDMDRPDRSISDFQRAWIAAFVEVEEWPKKKNRRLLSSDNFTEALF